MRNKLIIIFAIAFLFVLMGCTTPKYQFCCFADDAFPEDSSIDPVCRGINEEGNEEEREVVSCDEGNWTCIIESAVSGEEDIEVPVCPNIKTSTCESNCSGVFCGNFFYDPRPSYGMLPGDEAHAIPDEEEENTGVLEEPIGLWQAQCAVQKLDTLFLRKVENSDDITLNTFRFGIGESFEDFEQAQYYFPLTDLACELNPAGSVDRFVLYAIPNQKLSGGQLCGKTGETYGCTADSSIKSYSYFDCASRCALEIYDYEPEIEAYNPYLSMHEEEKIGNPFVYGPNKYDFGSYDAYPDTSDGVMFSRYFRNAVGPLQANDVDGYAEGTVLYGATFGDPEISKNSDEYSMLEYLAYQGYRSGAEGTEYVPYLGEGSWGYYFDWNWESQTFARTIFLTEEKNPHEIYPWLLAHHSIYNAQFEGGHTLANGGTKSGAEFECTSGIDCLSGYCNNFDYQRGACVGVDGEDILCDCHFENGKTLCIGSAGVDVPSWDDPSVDVEVPVALSAPVDIYGKAKGGGTQTLASLPSVGMVKVLPTCGLLVDWGEGQEEIAEAPFFILQLGGGQLSSTYGVKIPDYTVISWGADDELVKARWTLDPCSAIPEANYWGMTVDDLRTVYCCDGTTNCATPCTADDDDDDDCEVDTEVYGYPNPNQHATRFVENCMEGYKKYIHVCYNDDAKKEIGIWGWNMGAGGPFAEQFEKSSFFHKDDGETYEYKFCEYIAGKSGHIPTAQAEAARCYVWETSGGHIDLGGGDECTAESESYLVIEPRRVIVNDQVRWAFGKCLLNSAGDGLEINQYGICESCGYLTMAKQEITALPIETDWTLDPVSEDEGTMYGNTYCPDMVVHTPQTEWGIKERANPSSGVAFGSGNILEPYGMNGYNTYQFGSYEWAEEWVQQKCTYPNGYTVNERGEGAYRAGLPYTMPNAFYLNQKLESFMKRNIQPVIFAIDDGLWVRSIVDVEPNEYTVALQTDGSDATYATSTLLTHLYETRDYLFEGIEKKDDCSTTYGNCVEDYAGGEIYSSIGSFLGNTMINEGAAILVIEEYGTVCRDIGCSTPGDYDGEKRITGRGSAARLMCPNCMVSVAVGYGGGVEGFNLDDRKKEIDFLFYYNYLAGETSSPIAPYVDVISVRMELGDGNEYCSITGEEERFPLILANITNLGYETLKAHGKPLIITDFAIDRSGSCWSEESAGNLMAYLGTHNADLAKAGYLGLIYSDWESSTTDSTGVRFISNEGIAGYRGEFYAGTFTSARTFAGYDFTTFYTEVLVTDECQCVPCTAADSPALCNGKYVGNGPLCDGYESGENVKWPDNCITAGICHTPSMYVEGIECEVLYNNGSKEHIEIPIAEVMETPSAYRDVIASLDMNSPLCIATAGTGSAVTYVALEQGGYMATPAVFSTDGTRNITCDPTSGLLDSFCGYYPPIGDYKMECSYMMAKWAATT